MATGMYDVEVWHNGRHVTDLSTGSARRALERRDEILSNAAIRRITTGQVQRTDARVIDDTGRAVVSL